MGGDRVLVELFGDADVEEVPDLPERDPAEDRDQRGVVRRGVADGLSVVIFRILISSTHSSCRMRPRGCLGTSAYKRCPA